MLQKARNKRSGRAHHRNGKHQAENQNHWMLACRPCDGQDVVERHGNVSHDDLRSRLDECFPGPSFGIYSCNCSGSLLRFYGPCGGTVQLSPHFPAYPQQQNPAREQEADNLQNLRRQPGEQNAQHRRGDDADQNRLASLRLRQARGSKANDNGVVASEHKVDQNDLSKCGQDICAEKFKHGSRSPSCRENDPSFDARFLARRCLTGVTDTCRKSCAAYQNGATPT
jgi:hypothetical protein